MLLRGSQLQQLRVESGVVQLVGSRGSQDPADRADQSCRLLSLNTGGWSTAHQHSGRLEETVIFGKLSKDLITYVDDLLASTTTHEQTLELLERIFNECRYTGMKINLRKSFLGRTEIAWLGYNISAQGITCEYAKADAILNLQPPETIKQLQSHLGLFQYFAR